MHGTEKFQQGSQTNDTKDIWIEREWMNEWMIYKCCDVATNVNILSRVCIVCTHFASIIMPDV